MLKKVIRKIKHYCEAHNRILTNLGDISEAIQQTSDFDHQEVFQLLQELGLDIDCFLYPKNESWALMKYTFENEQGKAFVPVVVALSDTLILDDKTMLDIAERVRELVGDNRSVVVFDMMIKSLDLRERAVVSFWTGKFDGEIQPYSLEYNKDLQAFCNKFWATHLDLLENVRDDYWREIKIDYITGKNN